MRSEYETNSKHSQHATHRLCLLIRAKDGLRTSGIISPSHTDKLHDGICHFSSLTTYLYQSNVPKKNILSNSVHSRNTNLLNQDTQKKHPSTTSTKMPDLHLYYASGACSLAPHILLHETNIPFTSTNLRGANGIEFPPDFDKLNPKRKVPVLVQDSSPITELPAIATAIAHLRPDAHLMGATPLDNVRVLEWLAWLSGTLHTVGFGHFWRPQRFTVLTEEGAVQGVREKGREVVEEGFGFIEGKLREGKEYAVGEGFTAVDAFLAVLYRWGTIVGVDLKRFVKLTALVQGVLERPAVKAALKAEGIEFSIPN